MKIIKEGNSSFKEYKIDFDKIQKKKEREQLCREVQLHAFELGYKWIDQKTSKVSRLDAPYFFFGSAGNIGISSNEDRFRSDEAQAITPNDFLKVK